MDSRLDERKQKILLSIIQNYLDTGEPVGSRTISKLEGINLSSATIRNEMSDLEELGYITQPHTSAGRVPTDKGYRFYVDLMMEEKESELSDMKVMLERKSEKLDTVLKEAAKLIAENTNYASMITTPTVREKKLKFVQLSALDNESLLVVVVLEGNLVKNKIVKLEEELSSETILKLNLMLNTFLQGLDQNSINLGLIRKMKDESLGYTSVISDIIDAISDTFTEYDDVEMFTSGATNIFKYPELNESNKATSLLSVIEDQNQLKELMCSENVEQKNGSIQVYIGNESPIEATQDCSLVTATYQIEEGVYGKIGIIGPRRMNYEKVVDSLKNLMNELDVIFKKDE
ncbi:MAG: heat-inducible transcriptional repressor HrcA [Lachnospiraceae bacterium]|nr:heat-inducible transcriptional repressor HrcA [Lachnospiraceae bacterium]